MGLSIKKRVAFGLLTMSLSVGLLLSALLVADLYVHRRAERYAAVNAWGYRGPTVGRKRPGESRLVVLGGSTAFGYGVTADLSFPAQLESMLRPLSRNGAPVTVVNLGMNAQAAYAFRYDLEDYRYLDYDTVVLYEGYNDLSDSRNVLLARRESPVFRWTGYYPIFPVVFREKAMALRYGGDISAAYRDQKTVFKPGLADRATAAALQAAVDISSSLENQIGRLGTAEGVTKDNRRLTVGAHGCVSRWAHYCTAEYDGIKYALDRGKKVVVVTQPYLMDIHEEQQDELRKMLSLEFPGERRLRYVDLGPRFDVHAKEQGLFYDGMHATVEGNRRIANLLVGPVTELMSDAFNAPPAASRIEAPAR